MAWWKDHGDRREQVTDHEGRFKVCRKCNGSGSTRQSPQCPACRGKGVK